MKATANREMSYLVLAVLTMGVLANWLPIGNTPVATGGIGEVGLFY